jgi:hypothetical protein
VGELYACGLQKTKELPKGRSATFNKTTGYPLWCWGRNKNGVLGNSSVESSALPMPVGTAADRWIAVATGSSVTCGVKLNGSLWW